MAEFQSHKDVERRGGHTAQRMILGSNLRRLRERAGLSRADASQRIRGSESKISRLELGRVGFKERDVVDLLTAYGVTDESERDQVLKLVSQSNQPGWWHEYIDVISKWNYEYIGLEEAAAQIHIYEVQFVPGLLQTEDYARNIISYGHPEIRDDITDRRVAFRMRRQQMLRNGQERKFLAYIDESVLYRPMGGEAVLAAQIDRLLEWAHLPHIQLRIVPHRLSYAPAEGAFTFLQFREEELQNVVYAECLGGGIYHEKPEEISPYHDALGRLAIVAETVEHTRLILAERRAQL